MKRRTVEKTVRQARQKDLRINVEIKVQTWMKDSHGLFDYQANEEHYEVENYNASANCYIYRDPKGKLSIDAESKVRVLTTRSKSSSQNHIACIGSLCLEHSTSGKPSFRIKANSLPSSKSENHCQERLEPFIVLKDFTKNSVAGYPLSPGNIIRLGRVQFMVLQIKNSGGVQSLRDTVHVNQTSGIFNVEGKPKPGDLTTEPVVCKICLSDDDSPENPLIAPCLCKGSCQFLHLHCLRQWINSKVKKELHGIVDSYNFTKFECEICKSPFPSSVTNQEQNIEMMTIIKPQKSYIILETLHGPAEGREQKCLHVISADENNPVKMGRGHTSQIRVSDISVSRQHAQIVFIDNKYYLRDQGSKFGTLVNLIQDVLINEELPRLKLQCGRSVLEIVLGESQQPDQDTQ